MSAMTRRDLLKHLVGAALGVAGTVVLARATPSIDAQGAPPTGDVARRADRLAEDLPVEGDGLEPVAFVNGRFRNGGGGFRNSAFRNGGGFRNGGFVNGGGFRNGGFVNGGGFRNGSFRNW